MTKILEKAVGAAAKLPPKEQKCVASFLMEEVTRTELLAKIERAERDIAAGRLLTMEQARAHETMAKVVWTAGALKDLDEMAAYIAADNPGAAGRLGFGCLRKWNCWHGSRNWEGSCRNFRSESTAK